MKKRGNVLVDNLREIIFAIIILIVFLGAVYLLYSKGENMIDYFKGLFGFGIAI